MRVSKTLLRSIWVRIAAFYIAIFSLSLLCVLALIMFIGRNYLEQQIRARIATEMQFLLFEYREEGLAEVLEEAEERVDRRTPANMLLYVVENADGQTIFDPFPAPSRQPGWHILENQEESPQRYLMLYRQLENEYLLGVGADLSALDDFRSAVQRAVLWTVGVSLVIGVAFGILFGAFFSTRLRNVIQAVQAVAQGQLHTRLPGRSGSYEFELLARELNGMFQKVETLVANLKHVSSGLAHDLRTPLCILKNHLDDAARADTPPEQVARSLTKAEAELENLLRYFDSALLIVELESGELAQRFEPVELSALVDTMVENYRPLLEDAAIDVSVSIARALVVNGMPSLLQRLLSNILDNVLLHAARPGIVTLLCTRVDELSPEISLTITSSAVSDIKDGATGNSMNLQRVHRGTGQKIVSAIVALHGGRLTIEETAQSYIYDIRLPAASPPE